MTPVEAIHGRYVRSRRARVLAAHLVELLPLHCSVLDVGCGDGQIADLVLQSRADLSWRGVEVIARPNAHIPVELFDGHTLPCADASVDVVLLVDVLHHCDDPLAMLAEARRAAAQAIVIKDHLSDAVLATTTLRFMDRVGNRRHGVPLPYNYWRKSQWHDAFEKLHLHIDEWRDRLRLYPWPASLCFDRSLHFIARLHPQRMDAQ